MLSWSTGPLSVRRPMRMRSSYGPGPVFSVAGAGEPVMSCQSPLRKLTWISRAVGEKCGVMSNTVDTQVKLVSELNIDAWPQGETQSNESPGAGVSVLSRFVLARTRQPWTMLPFENRLPAKRRKESTVPVADGVVARLAHGLTKMSSSQLWTTAPPGPNAMSGKNAVRSGSVSSHAQVVFSRHLSLSLMWLKTRNHGALQNGCEFAVLTSEMLGFNAPSKFSLYAIGPVTTTLSMTSPAWIRGA